MTQSFTLAQLAEALGVDYQGDGELRLEGVSTLEKAGPNALTFLANPSYKKYLSSTKAGAVILNAAYAKTYPHGALISENPYATWAKALTLMHPLAHAAPGIASTACIDPSAEIHPTAVIRDHCVVGPHCKIGAEVILGPHSIVEANAEIAAHSRLIARVFIGHDCRLGQRTVVHPGVVIGGDGFGVALDNGHWRKVPQLGRVVLGDDCEIGANTTIDRGALGDTVLGNDVRIDNQVQIAHNVCIGDHTAIAGCVGIAGSTTIGAYCMIAGASGIGGHLTITDQVIITAMSTVVSSIHSPGTYGSGIPAQPHQRWKRILARLAKLDDWIGRLKKIEKGRSD